MLVAQAHERGKGTGSVLLVLEVRCNFASRCLSPFLAYHHHPGSTLENWGRSKIGAARELGRAKNGDRQPLQHEAPKRPGTSLADWAEQNAEDWGDQLSSEDVEGFTGRRF